ncbi:FRG domain-containing protein [Fibrobacter sp. UWEL]|uniref:FRG domain-containing protein n=1 Tax=Fibrobacter sp. UWEL TaxID=1896209 RepID=UPI00091215F0|nr:FRG domain-containing protein [Fibrobacter sp. UWEL]SHK79359.1 FRG domain-containing protein [Fibrobacter sp. UWEL]
MEKITSLTDFIERNKELTKGCTLYGEMIDSFLQTNSQIKQNDLYSKTFILRELERILDWEENRGYVSIFGFYEKLDQMKRCFQEIISNKNVFDEKDENVSRLVLTRTVDLGKRLELAIRINEFIQERGSNKSFITSLDSEKKLKLRDTLLSMFDDSRYDERAKNIFRIILNRLELNDGCLKYEQLNSHLDLEYDCCSLCLNIWGFGKEYELLKKAVIEIYLDCRSPINPFQFYYRGESSLNWRLLPNVLRHETSWSKESFYYHEMLVRCSNEFKNSTFLNNLVTMQHFGCPTRLLDVSMNSLVALYFACENSSQEDGRVYIFPTIRGSMSYADSEKALYLSCLPHLSINEQKNLRQELRSYASYNACLCNPLWTLDKLMSEVKLEKPSLQRISNVGDLMNPLFVQPDYSNDRIRNQQGAFIISGVFKSLDEAESRLKARTAKTCFIIEAESKKKILDELDSVGINKATVYPNIEKIAEYVKGL